MSDVQYERSLVLAKPDSYEGRHVGKIVTAIEEQKELSIIGLKVMWWHESLARRFYAEHEAENFFDGLVSFMCLGPLVAIVVDGADAVSLMRRLSGATHPRDADPGTFRRRFGTIGGGPRNATHASDSVESAEREILLLFEEHELIDLDD